MPESKKQFQGDVSNMDTMKNDTTIDSTFGNNLNMNTPFDDTIKSQTGNIGEKSGLSFNDSLAPSFGNNSMPGTNTVILGIYHDECNIHPPAWVKHNIQDKIEIIKKVGV